MSDYNMPVKAIKRILGEEIESHYRTMYQHAYSDPARGMLDIARDAIMSKLNAAQSYNDLEDVLDFANYRMSLSEWIESL